MKRNSLSQLNRAFENLTGEAIDGSENIINGGATVDVIDYIDGEDNTNEMQRAALLQSKASQELGLIVETTEQLEEFVAEKTEQLENGTVTADDVMVANEALAQACALYGITKPLTCSFEDISQDPKKALAVALEGIGDSIANGFKAVIEWFKKFFAGIWNFIKGLFGSTEKKVEAAKEAVEETKVNLEEIKKDKPKFQQKIKEIILASGKKLSNVKIFNPKNVKAALGQESFSISNEDMLEDALLIKAVDVLTSIKRVGVIMCRPTYDLDDVISNIEKLSTVADETKQMVKMIELSFDATKQDFEKVIREAKDGKTAEELIDSLLSNHGAQVLSGGALAKSFIDQVKNGSYGLIDNSYTDIKSIENELKVSENSIVIVAPNFKKTLNMSISSKVDQTHIFLSVIVISIDIKNGRISSTAKIHEPGVVINYEIGVNEKDFQDFINKGTDVVDKLWSSLTAVIQKLSPSVYKSIESDIERCNKMIESFVLELEKYTTDELVNSKVNMNDYLKMNHQSLLFMSKTINAIPIIPDVLLAAANSMLAYTHQILKLK